MSNAGLTADVNDELYFDPKLDNRSIAVSATDGKVAMRGTVGSLREKRDLERQRQRDARGHGQLLGRARRGDRAAWAAPGVTAVHDDLAVAY